MKYFKEAVLKYFKISIKFFKYFKVKYFIVHPYPQALAERAALQTLRPASSVPSAADVPCSSALQ